MESLVDDRTIVLGVPAYNEERHIGECLKSIQAQTFANFSVLISDNASSDGTSSICQRFAETDRRFVYFRHPLNIGAVANFRFLLDSTISPFFAWLGGHDILKPQYVETHLGILGKIRNLVPHIVILNLLTNLEIFCVVSMMWARRRHINLQSLATYGLLLLGRT